MNHHNFCLDGHIDLGDFSQIGRLYEKGTIAYKFYAKGNLPQDWEIENDIENILNTYEKFIEEHPDGIARIENPQQTNQFLTSPKTKVVEDETKIIDEVSKILKQVNYQKVEKKFHVLDPPKMQRVRDIISAVESKWKLPNFQRYFDWEPEDVREFIDSVFNDFYVGSFLLWEKAANTEPDLELINIDGVRESIKDPTAIILDGQQRITSLYWAIKGPRIDSKPRKVPEKYFYIDFRSFFSMATNGDSNSEKSDLVACLDEKFDKEDTYKKLLFPLYELEHYQSWINHVEDYLFRNQEQVGLSFDQIRSIRIVMTDRLSHVWDGFEIPCVFLPASIRLNQVAKIFEQLNTKGKVLGIFDLLMARLLKYHVHLRTYWDDCQKEYPNTISRYSKKYEKIPVYLVQSMSLYLDKSARSAAREDILDIYDRLFKNNSLSFKKYWDEMSTQMDWAINNLENQVSGYGVKDEKEVPSITTVTMSTSLHKQIEERPDKGQCYEKMDIWYWSSIFTNAYSGAVDTTMSAHYKELLLWFDDENQIPNVVVEARREIENL